MMQITFLDGIFVALVLVSAILGWLRGLTREAIGLVCFAVAGMIVYAYALNAGVGQWLRPSFRYMASYVFLGAVIVTFLVAAWVSHFGMAPWITTGGRIGGLLFGLVRGILIFAFAVVLIDLFVRLKDLPVWFTGAKSRELANEYMRLFWPKEWTGIRLLSHPFVMMGIAALYLSVVTDLIAAVTRPYRLRLRR
ncbi:MAG: CvpA family protein [Xanthobacteraceae bacterium]|nr:CvpA family protein [Xanthobacteraceae bacterium]